MTEFRPHPWLRNAHAMTLTGALWPRPTRGLPPPRTRLFEVEAGTSLLAKCHWQADPRNHPALAIVHGLEGSADSGYVRGLAASAFRAGFNVVRLNQRNCGGSERLTPTLYNSGMSDDYRAVLFELIERDRLREVFFAGYSMGGNLVLKMAGELGGKSPAELRGVCGVCPTIDLEMCVRALESRGNWLYEANFVFGLKRRLRRKNRLCPEKFIFRRSALRNLRTVRGFDELVTAPSFGYASAAEYYAMASAARTMEQIKVPTLILTAKDDPFVPFAQFEAANVRSNACITLVGTDCGGHCSFIADGQGSKRYWAEERIVEFCLHRANAQAQARG